MSRRQGVLSVLLLSLCTAMTGCLNTGGDQPMLGGGNGYSPVQRASYPNPNGLPPALMNMPDQKVQQAQFAGAFPGKPDEALMEPGMVMGPPTMPGGAYMTANSPPQPGELKMVTHSPHRVAAPDILQIEALRLIPKGPYKLEAMEVLQIEVTDTLPKEPIKGMFMISPEGRISLGHTYGSVLVGGMTVDQAQHAIRHHLTPIIKGAFGTNVTLVQMRGMQNIRGDHLVRPDGTVSLGMYGAVFVAGMTLGEVKCTIENHLSVYLVAPQVSVDVRAYNSRKIYIIADTLYNFRQQVIALPATGNETVLDAISRVQGLPATASLKKIWVARPSPAGHPCSTVLPVDWKAITQAGRTETNYQLLPGDRIYISSDPFALAYFNINKMLLPIERVLDFGFRASTTFQSFRSGGNTGLVIVP